MKRIFPITLPVVILFGVLDAIQAHLTHRIYDLQNNMDYLKKTFGGHAHAVILPEIKGVIDSKTVDQSDADYIMLGL